MPCNPATASATTREKAADELAHYRTILPQMQDALDEVAKDFSQKVDEAAKRAINGISAIVLWMRKQHRLDAMTRAQKQLADVGR